MCVTIYYKYINVRLNIVDALWNNITSNLKEKKKKLLDKTIDAHDSVVTLIYIIIIIETLSSTAVL